MGGRLGIIAAKGGLVEKLVKYCLNHKLDIFILAIEGETNPDLLINTPHAFVSIGQIGKAIKILQHNQIERLVFCGSLKKPDLLNLKVDSLGTKLLAKIAKNKFFGDNQILSTLTEFLQEYGFKVIGVDNILDDLLVKASNMTIVTPNAQDMIDIALGIEVTDKLGLLDIGQAAIIQNAVVLGVEAIEGTDALIKRCGQLKLNQQHGGVLVKFSKPKQELRIDLPTIGMNTIENLQQAGFKGIVIEAEKTIFLDQQKVIDYANKYEMFVLSTNREIN